MNKQTLSLCLTRGRNSLVLGKIPSKSSVDEGHVWCTAYRNKIGTASHTYGRTDVGGIPDLYTDYPKPKSITQIHINANSRLRPPDCSITTLGPYSYGSKCTYDLPTTSARKVLLTWQKIKRLLSDHNKYTSRTYRCIIAELSGLLLSEQKIQLQGKPSKKTGWQESKGHRPFKDKQRCNHAFTFPDIYSEKLSSITTPVDCAL